MTSLRGNEKIKYYRKMFLKKKKKIIKINLLQLHFSVS
jgi:hypothetical protein